MKAFETEVPDRVYDQIAALVKGGWFRDENEVFGEAIRRFLDSHQPEIMEEFIRNDVEWGLHGDD